MDIVKEVKERFGKMPAAISYKDLCEILGRKYAGTSSIDNEILDAGEALAKASPRKRFLIVLHTDLKETAHRMINTLVKGTYAQPHVHTDPNTSEEFTALRGAGCVIEFDATGKVVKKLPFGRGYKTNLIEIRPGTVHTIIPLTDLVSCFEVKGQTNYDPSKDKSFFPWAPKEDSDSASIQAYLQKLDNL